MDNMAFTKSYKAQLQRIKEEPEAFELARIAIKEWGDERKQLMHAIADAIVIAHAMGAAGKALPSPKPRVVEAQEEPIARVSRVARTRPAPTPPRAVRISRAR